MPESGWTTRLSLHYRDQLRTRAYRHRRQEIDRRIAVLLRDPYHMAGAERLMYRNVGLRSAEMFAGVRLIYRICEECRKLGEGSGRWALDCCTSAHTIDRTVNILCLSDHYAADIPEDLDFDD